jgi:hypothetical protein
MCEGIIRIPGNKDAIYKIRHDIDSGKILKFEKNSSGFGFPKRVIIFLFLGKTRYKCWKKSGLVF